MDVKLVVFDWSGTISDDRKMIYESVLRLFKELNRDAVTFDEWLSTSVGSFHDFVKMQGMNMNDITALKNMHIQHLNDLVTEGTKPFAYPDAHETLKYLFDKGKKIAILSTHPQSHLLREAEEYGLLKFIGKVVGDSMDKSIHLSYLCQEFGVKPEETLFIGDMIFDIQAAKKVGTLSAGVTTGYHTKESLESHNPDYIFSNLTELRGIL